MATRKKVIQKTPIKKPTTKNAKKVSPRPASSKEKTKRKGRSPKAAGEAGKAFERDAAALLRHIFPLAERELEFQASGNRGNDVKGCDPFLFQCKSYANYVSISKINEVRPKKGEIPVLLTKGVNLKPMAILPFADFIRVLESAFGAAPLMEARMPTLEGMADQLGLDDAEPKDVEELFECKEGEGPALTVSEILLLPVRERVKYWPQPNGYYDDEGNWVSPLGMEDEVEVCEELTVSAFF